MKLRSAGKPREIRLSVPGAADVRAIAASPDGKRMAWGNSSGNITVADLSSIGQRRSWQAYDARYKWAVSGLMFSPDGRWLLVSSSLQSTLWNLDTGTLAATLNGYPLSIRDGPNPAAPVVLLDEEQQPGLMGKPPCLGLYRSDGSLLRTIPHPQGKAFGPNGQFLKLADGRFMKWNPETRQTDYVLTLLQSSNWRAPLLHREDPEWMVTHPGSPYYSSSASGDEYAYIRFGPYLSGLRNYRDRFRRNSHRP